MNLPYQLLLLSCFAISLFGSCKTVQISPEKYEKTKVYFGNGGGFTGELREFCLLENGDVFQINPSSREATLRNSKGKSMAKSIFKSMDEMDFKKYTYDKPGNLYYWMKYHTDTDSTYLIWGDSEMEVEAGVVHMYEQLVELTKKSK